MKRILIILMSLFSAVNAGELAIQKFPSYYKLSSKDFNADIPNYMVSKQVRSMDPTKLAAVLNSGNAYLDINECSDGQYSMDIQGRVKGGGGGGGVAGFWIARGLWYGVTYGTIGVVSALTGPAAPATFAALSATFAPAIETTALGVSAAGAILGAVITGPV